MKVQVTSTVDNRGAVVEQWRPTKSLTKLYLVCRTGLAVVLLVIFVWQTYESVQRYLERRISTTYEPLYPSSQVFPSLTFCPLFNGGEEANDHYMDWGFQDELSRLEAKAGGFVKTFEHDKLEVTSVSDIMDDVANVSNEWRHTWAEVFTLGHTTANISSCITYSPPFNFSGGLDSMVGIVMDVRALHQLTIYMHEPRRMVLAPTFLYGSFYLQLPRVKEGWHADLAYRVVTKKHTVLNRDSLPCHPDDRKDLHDCIERYAQDSLGCHLPWRSFDSSLHEKVCEGNEELIFYKRMYYDLFDASAHDIFKRTGCTYACSYLAFEPHLISSNENDDECGVVEDGEEGEDADEGEDGQDGEEGDCGNFRVSFFLHPGGLISEREIITYDIDSLVGNVGGFLGLFLGASCLSIFDSLVNKMGAMIRKWE